MKSVINTLLVSIVLCGYVPTMLGAAASTLTRGRVVAIGALCFLGGIGVGAQAMDNWHNRGPCLEQRRMMAEDQALSLLVEIARLCGKIMTEHNTGSHIALLTADAVKPDKATLMNWVKSFTSGDQCIFSVYRDTIHKLLQQTDTLLHNAALKAVPAKKILESQCLSQLRLAYDMLHALRVRFNLEFQQEISDEKMNARKITEAEERLKLEVQDHHKYDVLAKRVDGQDARTEGLDKRFSSMEANLIIKSESVARLDAESRANKTALETQARALKTLEVDQTNLKNRVDSGALAFSAAGVVRAR